MDWTDIQYFHANDFDSPDALGSGELMERDFVLVLDEIRRLCDFRFVITSGFRSLPHNQDVGGKPNSAHTRGWAADIACTTSWQRFLIVSHALACGVRRIEIGRTWVHLDMDPSLPPDMLIYV